MERAVMISIQPQHAINIVKRFKTLELRKSIPKGFVGWVYVYVTKAKPYLFYKNGYGHFWTLEHKKMGIKYDSDFDDLANGKIVARFWFDEYSFMERFNDDFVVDGAYDYNQLFQDGVHPSKMCLTPNELERYGKGKSLYAWHIKNLEIFDEPKELTEFYTKDISECVNDMEVCEHVYRLKRAPQAWQFVWVREE